MSKLTSGKKHILQMINKEANPEGWAKVSNAVMPLIRTMPSELVEVEQTIDDNRVRLTEKGRAILDAMEWLL